MNNLFIPPLDRKIGQKVSSYIDTLTKPKGSLGKLEDIALTLSKMTGEPFPIVTPPGVIVFAADHGIVEEGVSSYPKEVTTQMVMNFVNGGAAINVFSRQIGAMFKIVDIGVDGEINHENIHSKKIRYGTKNFLYEPAMTRKEAEKAVQVGFEEAEAFIQKGVKCLILGEMGIGNTTSSSALLALITNSSVENVVGYGTGISDDQKKKKEEIIQKAIEKHQIDNINDGYEILSKVGGFEIAGMAGAMLAAAKNRIPILLDGFICTVAACIAKLIHPNVCDYMIATHRSVEQGHSIALGFIQKDPLIDLNLRLGEGSGAAVAYPMILSASLMLKEMATFTDAGVSEKQGD